MNNLDKQYQALLREWEIARRNFQCHVMKVTYGDKRDMLFNTKQAKYFDSIIKELKKKIISYEHTR